MYNSYASPNLADISPFELVFGRKANICPEFEFKPQVQVPITGIHKQAFDELQKKLKYFRVAFVEIQKSETFLVKQG